MICYIDGINKIVTEGKLVGTLTKKVSSRFNSDTPLNSIFIPEGYNKPLIDLNKSEVGNLHRVRALEKFKKEINRLINKNI